MSKIDKLIRVFFITALVISGVFIFSGIFVAVTTLTNPNEIKKQITLSMYDQQETFNPIEKSLLPGESLSFDLSVKSNLLERVKYDVTFSNHNVNDIDQYFYVSITNDKKENLINNTLDQIFIYDISIQGILDSNESAVFHVTFSLSSFFSASGSYDFNMNVNALGRIFN